MSHQTFRLDEWDDKVDQKYAKLKVGELRKRAADKDLEVDGSRDVLIKRLKASEEETTKEETSD